MIQYKFDTYSTDEGVDFQYTIWECDGDFETPAYYAVEIDKIIYKDTDIKDLIFNIADKYVGIIKEKIQEKEI